MKASQDNIKSAIGYLNTLPEIGGTNISGAVEAAYASAANVEAIYFLSDGSPTGGLKDVTDLKNKLNALNKDKTDKKLNAIKIHVTSFMLGGSEKDDEKKSAKAFMQTLADTT